MTLLAFERVACLRGDRLLFRGLSLALGPGEDLPWMKRQTRLTFARVGVIDPLSLDDYLRYPHVMTTLTGTGPGVVDEALTRIGRQRKLLATTPRFATVPFLVQASPVLTTMVAALATRFAGMMDLATSPVPVELKDFTVSMLWHSSYDHDPAHRWLRDLLLRASRGPAGPG